MVRMVKSGDKTHNISYSETQLLNNPMILVIEVWANTAEPDQTAPCLIRVYTVAYLISDSILLSFIQFIQDSY